MKRIYPTRKPSAKTISDIASNLREKFDKAVCVELSVWSHSTNNNTQIIRLSLVSITADTCDQETFNTWQEFLDHYRKLMSTEVSHV